MQLTSKLIFLTVALVYGSTAVSALPVKEFSITARSVEYKDFNAREVDEMELFVRHPFGLFGYNIGSSSHAHDTSHDTYGSQAHVAAALSRTESGSETSPVTSVHKTELVESKRKGRGPRYDPKPTMDVASRRQFRKIASQNSTLLNEAAKDKNHAFHSTAIHMKQEAALRRKPKLLKQALRDPKHPLHEAALTVEAQNRRRKAIMRAALKDEGHPLHAVAVAHQNEQQDKTIRNAQTKNPKLVETALANKNHQLHEAAHRVAAQDNVVGFNALPFGS